MLNRVDCGSALGLTVVVYGVKGLDYDKMYIFKSFLIR